MIDMPVDDSGDAELYTEEPHDPRCDRDICAEKSEAMHDEMEHLRISDGDV